MAVPTAPDWSASELITEAKLDSISTVLNFLLAPPRCYAYKTGSGAIAAGTWNALNLDAEAYDSGGLHDNTTNNSRVTATEAGLYCVFAQVRFAGVGGTAGVRGLQVRKNAAAVDTAGTRLAIEHRDVTGGGQATIFGHQFDSQLVAGDYVEAFAFNGDSTVRNVDGGLSETFLGIRWVSRTV